MINSINYLHQWAYLILDESLDTNSLKQEIKIKEWHAKLITSGLLQASCLGISFLFSLEIRFKIMHTYIHMQWHLCQNIYDGKYIHPYKCTGLFLNTYLNNFKLLDNFVLKVKLYILYSLKVFMVIQGHISIGPMLKQGQYLIHHYNMGLPRQHYDYKMDFVCIK